MTQPGVRAVVGPTGAGKSTLAMRLATGNAPNAPAGPVEIVAVDAFTIYRGMDIGTAKPSAADRARVRHHMVDVLDPDADVTVAWFQAEARRAIADIHGRGATALLVGGSGLYFRAVVDDLQFPPTDPDVRARIEARWADDPRGAHAHLADVDPDAAVRIEPDNLRRSVRALEVREVTGRPFSAFATTWDDHTSIYPGLEVTYLEPPADTLKAAIHGRARAMVEQGLLDEVAELRRRFPAGLSATARQAIGVREAHDVLDGTADEAGLVDRIARRTWRYARRQRSWFRRDPRCVPGAGDAPGRTGSGQK